MKTDFERFVENIFLPIFLTITLPALLGVYFYFTYQLFIIGEFLAAGLIAVFTISATMFLLLIIIFD